MNKDTLTGAQRKALARHRSFFLHEEKTILSALKLLLSTILAKSRCETEENEVKKCS